MTPSSAVFLISLNLIAVTVDAKMKRFMMSTPPWITASRWPPISMSIRCVVCSIGHHITGANNAIGRNCQPRRLAQDGPRGFEIAVWAPEDHQGVGDTKQGNRSRHDAF